MLMSYSIFQVYSSSSYDKFGVHLFIHYLRSKKSILSKFTAIKEFYIVILFNILVTKYRMLENKKRCRTYGKKALKYNNLPEHRIFLNS
jgi:hypothetical protein